MGDESLLVSERRKELVRVVREEGRVLAVDAARKFGVSEDSIRRDLRALAADGLVQRVRGGALPAPASAPIRERARSIPAATGPLAVAVADHVQEVGGLVVLDSGLTNLAIAQSLTSAGLTLVTSSPAIAAAGSANGLSVVMLGGVVSVDIGASVDATAVEALRTIRADVAVLGTCAVDVVTGVSTARADEVAFKRAVVASGAELVLAATAGKLGTTAAFGVADPFEVSTLFTDSTASGQLVEGFEAVGIEVCRA